MSSRKPTAISAAQLMYCNSKALIKIKFEKFLYKNLQYALSKSK